MTLCIAWRDHNSAIHLASDSRVSRRGNPVADSMAKVYRLDATLIVRRPSARSGRSEHPVQLGVAIAGAALPHFVLAQTLGHIVRRVHAVEWDQDSPPPLDPLMKTVCKVLRPVTQAFGFMEPQHARLKLVIAGRCPGNETNRAFVVESDGDDPTYHEVLRPSDDPVYPFGDVDERLRERCLSASHPLQAVVEARDDPGRVSIGGPVQHGRLRNGFRCSVVYDEFEDHLGVTRAHPFLSGVPVHDQPPDDDGQIYGFALPHFRIGDRSSWPASPRRGTGSG